MGCDRPRRYTTNTNFVIFAYCYWAKLVQYSGAGASFKMEENDFSYVSRALRWKFCNNIEVQKIISYNC